MALIIMKYIMPKSKNDEYLHYEYCQKNKYPFITVKKQGTRYTEIFYDVTNSKLCLKSLAEKMRNFYMSYIEFAHIPICDIQNYLDNMYLFNFIVNVDDADFIASRLFDYLLVEIENAGNK